MGNSASNTWVIPSGHQQIALEFILNYTTTRPGQLLLTRDIGVALRDHLQGHADVGNGTMIVRELNRMLNLPQFPVFLLRAPTIEGLNALLNTIGYVPSNPAAAPVVAGPAPVPAVPVVPVAPPVPAPAVAPVVAPAAAPVAAAAPPVAPIVGRRGNRPRRYNPLLNHLIQEQRLIQMSRQDRNRNRHDAIALFQQFQDDTNNTTLQSPQERAQAFRVFFLQRATVGRRPSHLRYDTLIHLLDAYDLQYNMGNREAREFLMYRTMQTALNRVRERARGPNFIVGDFNWNLNWN